MRENIFQSTDADYEAFLGYLNEHPSKIKEAANYLTRSDQAIYDWIGHRRQPDAETKILITGFLRVNGVLPAFPEPKTVQEALRIGVAMKRLTVEQIVMDIGAPNGQAIIRWLHGGNVMAFTVLQLEWLLSTKYQLMKPVRFSKLVPELQEGLALIFKGEITVEELAAAAKEKVRLIRRLITGEWQPSPDRLETLRQFLNKRGAATALSQPRVEVKRLHPPKKRQSETSSPTPVPKGPAQELEPDTQVLILIDQLANGKSEEFILFLARLNVATIRLYLQSNRHLGHAKLQKRLESLSRADPKLFFQQVNLTTALTDPVALRAWLDSTPEILV